MKYLSLEDYLQTITVRSNEFESYNLNTIFTTCFEKVFTTKGHVAPLTVVEFVSQMVLFLHKRFII